MLAVAVSTIKMTVTDRKPKRVVDPLGQLTLQTVMTWQKNINKQSLRTQYKTNLTSILNTQYIVILLSVDFKKSMKHSNMKLMSEEKLVQMKEKRLVDDYTSLPSLQSCCCCPGILNSLLYRLSRQLFDSAFSKLCRSSISSPAKTLLITKPTNSENKVTCRCLHKRNCIWSLLIKKY